MPEITCEKCSGTGLINQGENLTNTKKCTMCDGKGVVLTVEGPVNVANEDGNFVELGPELPQEEVEADDYNPFEHLE